MNCSLLVALVAMTYSALGKEIPTSLSRWTPTAKRLSKDEWYAANVNGTTWDVYLEGKDVKVRPYDFARERPSSLELRDGRLISANRGEFGAAVFWAPNKGRRITISEDPVEQFIQLVPRIFAISGLAHMGLNFGEVLEFKRKASAWKVSRIAKLKDAPIKAIRENETNLLVLTYSSLSRVSLAGRTTLIVGHGEWDGLIPRSLAMDEKGFAYVGFRQRVGKVELKTGKVTYFIPYPEIFAEDLNARNERRE
jgi:hypothetical protein